MLAPHKILLSESDDVFDEMWMVMSTQHHTPHVLQHYTQHHTHTSHNTTHTAQHTTTYFISRKVGTDKPLLIKIFDVHIILRTLRIIIFLVLIVGWSHAV